jgi:CheY-like chemotaxis protein
MSPVRDKRRRLECVLTVDDAGDVQRIVKIALERLGGIRVHACTDSQRAMEIAREVVPDLILLDYVMPGLDGVALFKRIQADPVLARIPVVFMTASATALGIKELQTLGAAGIVLKPFNVHELPRQLSEIWDGLNTTGSESGPPHSKPPLD